MVEKISIRSFRLRHHRGAINTIPFGEIHSVMNFSRDWVMMKLEMRVPSDTDLEKLRKVVKKVGQQIMDDPELGAHLLQPVKSQGVHRMDDDGAFVIRIKFMAKPGEQFVLRREVFRRVQGHSPQTTSSSRPSVSWSTRTANRPTQMSRRPPSLLRLRRA